MASPTALVNSTGTLPSPPSGPAIVPPRSGLACPESKPLRERLRAMAADLVGSWRAGVMPSNARSAAGLRHEAESLVQRAGGGRELVGWTMVTIVSEFWRERLAAGTPGRRLLLLPDCPVAPVVGPDATVPHVCGPSCAIATIWSAARESGWVVESTERAVPAIGALLTGQYDGILGVAKLSHLEKAFAMLPAFSLPIAAVPYDPSRAAAAGGACGRSLASAMLDVDWVLGLLGVAGGAAAPVADYLPLLREAAEMFAPEALGQVAAGCGVADAFGPLGSASGTPWAPMDATGAMSGEYLTRGGKFLRPFIALAAFDAIVSDRAEAATRPAAAPREAVKAAAVAIEIFHKASLIHDDIEDADTMRYGRRTLHLERGIPAAINAGDYLLGLGYRLVSSLPGIDAGMQRDLVAILADAHVRLARGQGAELAWRDAADKRLSPAEALEIYGLKTSPAFEAALAMGIRLAGIQPADAGAIARYALHVGNGFQVLNDLKDWHGDLENDRRAAGDLLGGRPTVMWALALEQLSEADVARLASVARDAATAADSAAIATARGLYEQADVFARAAAIVTEQRRLAAAAAATCRCGRLRDVLEFLLDLAVPEQAAASLAGSATSG